MLYDQNAIYNLYRKLLTFYPQGFRERLGESMEQTFRDLCNKQKHQPGQSFFLLAIFAETAVGIVREYLLVLKERDVRKGILANPRSVAIASLILAMPLGLTYVALLFNREPLARVLNNLFTIDGQEINMLGRIVIYGGLLLLPVAFVLNLRSMLKREGPEGKRRLYTINIIVGVAILMLILFTWGGLILEEIYCLQGIRCD
jgi:hypothetical protein